MFKLLGLVQGLQIVGDVYHDVDATDFLLASASREVKRNVFREGCTAHLLLLDRP